jgi:hypothetical protein
MPRRCPVAQEASARGASRSPSPPRATALHGPGDAQPLSPRGGASSPPTSPRVGYVAREPEPLVFAHHLQRLVPADAAAAKTLAQPPPGCVCSAACSERLGL